MFDSIISYFSTDENISKLIFAAVGVLIGFVLKDLILTPLTKLVKFLFGKLFKVICMLFSKVYNGIKSKYKKARRYIDYRVTIRKIVKKKIAIPDHFLSGKSAESNPELKKIFDMIENGQLEEPKFYKLEKYFKENPIDVNELLGKVDTTPKINVKPINFDNFKRRDN